MLTQLLNTSGLNSQFHNTDIHAAYNQEMVWYSMAAIIKLQECGVLHSSNNFGVTSDKNKSLYKQE